MDRNTYIKLQQEFKNAVLEKNMEKINYYGKILGIPEEQYKYVEMGLTGFPSVDEVWYKYYPENSKCIAHSFPRNKTVWDEMEEQLKKYYDYDAIEYFKKKTSRPEFIDKVYKYAKVFKEMGVEEDEVVPIYGPFTPDLCAITFALNVIGATGYFLKLAISPESLAKETKDSRFAIVYDGMWKNVGYEFSKDKFKNVLVYSISQNMPSPKKEIVSFLSKISSMKEKSGVPNDKKYIYLDKVLDIAKYNNCSNDELKADFVPNRNAFITSSSGTTGGMAKGIVATNESVLAQMYQSNAVDVQYYPGDRVLNHFPPAASTSLNSLFLIPLYHGSTVLVDPRVTPNDFYFQITKLKPTLCVNTGSAWELFFNRIEKEMKEGKKFDFSFAKGWVIGGEGTDVKKFLRWQDIMKKCNCPDRLCSAYGQSELFSAATSEQTNAKGSLDKQIMGVGIPYSGLTVGIYDEDGRELTYNKRGELVMSGYTAMKEYYKKPELTKEIKVDGEIHSGDIAEIDENGFVYVWGRSKDKIILPNGDTTYLFDIANLIKTNPYIYDTMVFKKGDYLTSHIVWDKNMDLEQKKEQIKNLNFILESNGVEIAGYFEHDICLPYSNTTLKKDRTLMRNQDNGYIQVENDNICNVDFSTDSEGKIVRKVSNMDNNKIKVLK